MEFLRSFLRRHFVGKPFLASRNVVCFLRLLLIATIFYKNWIVHSFHGSYLKGSKQGSGKFTVMKCDFVMLFKYLAVENIYLTWRLLSLLGQLSHRLPTPSPSSSTWSPVAFNLGHLSALFLIPMGRRQQVGVYFTNLYPSLTNIYLIYLSPLYVFLIPAH